MRPATPSTQRDPSLPAPNAPPGAPKAGVDALALFGGPVSFSPPVSTSNLVRPDWAAFSAGIDLLYDRAAAGGAAALEARLEARAAAYHHTRFAVATANGFWALVLAIRALALPGRREVVMPSLTYRRLADIVAWCGLVPHFCEVDPATLALSPATVRPCLNERTALILGVHPIVNTCDAPGLEALAAETGLPLLFDAVESVHEAIGGRKVGGFGRAEVFSMHASKLINGFEGGYITTDDPVLAARLRALRDRAPLDEAAPAELGVDSRLSPLHAALTLAGFDDLPAQVERNRARYRLYQRLLPGLPGVRLLAFDETQPTSFKTIVVELGPEWPLSRDRTVDLLNREGVLVRAYYAPPLHRKKMQYPTVPVELPLSDALAARFMLMPCGHLVSLADIERTVALMAWVAANADEIRARWPA